MKNLQKKYKEIKSKDINENIIIYFCRDALSFSKSASEKKKFEIEIFDLIKSKEWDWSFKDIDSCTILTYAIYNNSFLITDYIMDNKLDYKIYNTSLSHDICASVNQLSHKMMEHILKKQIHQSYFTDMLINAYNMMDAVSIDYKHYYSDKADLLIKKDIDFNSIIHNFIVQNEKLNEHGFFHFSNNYPLDKSEQIKLIDNFIDTKIINKKFVINKSKSNIFINNLNDKLNFIQKWKLLNDLEKIPNNNLNNQKFKI